MSENGGAAFDTTADLYGKNVTSLEVWHTYGSSDIWIPFSTGVWMQGTAENYQLPILINLAPPDADAGYLRPDPVSVTYDVNNGTSYTITETVTSFPYRVNSSENLSMVSPDPVNYSVFRWNNRSDGSGVWYSAGENLTVMSFPDGNLTLYANWTPTLFTITYNATGTSPAGQDSIRQAPYNSTYTVLSNTVAGITNLSGSFTGWSTNPAGPVNVGATLFITGNITLYPGWGPMPFVPDSGGEDDSGTDDSGTDDSGTGDSGTGDGGEDDGGELPVTPDTPTQTAVPVTTKAAVPMAGILAGFAAAAILRRK
jgi:hypothetical protein